MTERESILDKIVAEKRAAVAKAQQAVPLEQLKARMRGPKETRPFAEALQQGEPLGLVAEIKRQSPSRGVLRERFDPIAIAQDYQAAGAHALSVLTDEPSFGGRLEYIREVKQFTELPVLRKDFILEPYQVYESAVAEADAILLIVAILEQDDLFELHHLARSLGLEVLVEVHSEAELTQALGIHATLIGINHRDLHTFTMDVSLSERLRPHIPQSVTVVAESGLTAPADIQRMRRADVDAVLIGEAFMVQADIQRAVKMLMGWP